MFLRLRAAPRLLAAASLPSSPTGWLWRSAPNWGCGTTRRSRTSAAAHGERIVEQPVTIHYSPTVLWGPRQIQPIPPGARATESGEWRTATVDARRSAHVVQSGSYQDDRTPNGMDMSTPKNRLMLVLLAETTWHLSQRDHFELRALRATSLFSRAQVTTVAAHT
jgi:hypothetical protein